MLMFEELSDIFSDHNNHLTSRELLMKVRLLVRAALATALESIPGGGARVPFSSSGPMRKPRVTGRQTFEFLLFMLKLKSSGLRKFKVQLLGFTVVQLDCETCAHVRLSQHAALQVPSAGSTVGKRPWNIPSQQNVS